MTVVRRRTDPARTDKLGLPELLVLADIGDEDHFFCVPKRTFQQCPTCGNLKIRNQGNMHREYLDVIPRDDDAAVITISLEFRKNKCMLQDCGSVFYPSFSFASRYSRTTHRFDNVVVRMILEEGLSYTLISEALGGILSKQVIGQIYYRRMNELESNPAEQPGWFKEYMEDDPDRLWRILRYRPRQRQNSYDSYWFLR